MKHFVKHLVRYKLAILSGLLCLHAQAIYAIVWFYVLPLLGEGARVRAPLVMGGGWIVTTGLMGLGFWQDARRGARTPA